MGSSMTCKQQYCCGNMRDCTGPYKRKTAKVRTVNAGFART